MTRKANARELGSFLRAHRERIRPEQVGLPATPRRRTPGLRREEVAAMSGVGVAWYSWLEQGRVVGSKQVLDAIARSLNLKPASHRHLLALAGVAAEPVRDADPGRLAGALAPLLDSWPSSPAVLVDASFDVTAWNQAFSTLWCDPKELDAGHRNLMWMLIGDPTIGETLVHHRQVARTVLKQFRAQTARHAEDDRVRELYDMLRVEFPDLKNWWRCQGVDDLRVGEIGWARRPTGLIRFRCSAFRPVDDPESLMIVQTPATDQDQARVASVLKRAQAARLRGLERSA